MTPKILDRLSSDKLDGREVTASIKLYILVLGTEEPSEPLEAGCTTSNVDRGSCSRDEPCSASGLGGKGR